MTIAQLGIDLSSILTRSTLADALSVAIKITEGDQLKAASSAAR